MKIYNTKRGLYVESENNCYAIPNQIVDFLFNVPDLSGYLREICRTAEPVGKPAEADLIAPIGTQEVWAAGVTYKRSREARQEESKDGGDVYWRIYEAERPELFFKANGFRVIGPGGKIRIRRDAHWSVPEPEVTLVINREGNIVGYTVGNDVSSRDIEGQNPLYLPQAKVYNGSCALGPAILVAEEALRPETEIQLDIWRAEELLFSGTTTLSQMNRSFEYLVHYLFSELTFPMGAFLMTGTGIVPPGELTLLTGDRVRITVAGIGALINVVE